MKIGITQIITGNRSLDQTLDLCRRAGYDAIELVFGEGRDPDVNASAADIKDIAKRCADAGVSITSVIAWYKDRGNMLSPDADERAKAVRSLTRSLEIGGELGVGATLLHPGQLTVQGTYQQAWDNLLEELGRVEALAAKAGVAIGVENVWNKFILSPKEAREFVDAAGSPWIGIYLDTANMMAYGYPEHWIRGLGSRIKRVHFKDFKRREHQFVPLGEGDTDWPTVVADLRAVGYDHSVIHEVSGDDELQIELARRMREFVGK